MSTEETRTAHWGTCSNEDCLTCIVIYPHDEANADLPDEDEWSTEPFFLGCPVCNSSMDWGGTDHPADIIKGYPRGVSA